MVKTWIVIMDTDREIYISDDEKRKMVKSMATRGGNFPFFETESFDYIFYHHISSIRPSEILPDPVEIPEEEVVEEVEDKDPLAGISPEEKLALMMKLSACSHAEEKLYKRETKTGLKYFHICKDCGRRGRFVKAESLSDLEKTQAEPWFDKD